MNKPMKQQTRHKVWAWISLSINIAVASAVYACYTGEKKALIVGMIFALFSIAQGVSLAWRDRDKKLSSVAVVLDYLCVLALSILGICEMIERTTLAVCWWFIPVLLLEAIGVYLIARGK